MPLAQAYPTGKRRGRGNGETRDCLCRGRGVLQGEREGAHAPGRTAPPPLSPGSLHAAPFLLRFLNDLLLPARVRYWGRRRFRQLCLFCCDDAGGCIHY